MGFIIAFSFSFLFFSFGLFWWVFPRSEEGEGGLVGLGVVAEKCMHVLALVGEDGMGWGESEK